MQNRPQRNEPCHCGSGKKYKKCCLISDVEKDNIEMLDAEIVDEDSDYFLPDMGDLIGDDLSDTFQNPDITPEQNEILEDWWNEMDELDNYKQEVDHIKTLINDNPKLVEHSGIEESIVFDLVIPHLRDNRYADFIALLMELEQKCPEAYSLSSDYYNYYIIVGLIHKGSINEIPKYLNQYTNSDSEKLVDVIRLLEATNNYNILLPFINSSLKTIIDNEYFMALDFLLDPLIGEIILANLKPDFSATDIKEVIQNIKALNIDVEDHMMSESFWENQYNNILRPYKPWDTKKPKLDKQLSDIYNDIINNYLGFLIFEKKLSHNYSFYMYAQMREVLFSHLEHSSKKPKSIFKFTIKIIDITVMSLAKDMIWVNQTKIYSMLLSTYYFMEYLEKCGNIQSDERKQLQKEISDLYNKNYEKMVVVNEETLVLNSIP